MPEELMLGAGESAGGGADIAVADAPEIEGAEPETERPSGEVDQSPQPEGQQPPKITDIKSAWNEFKKSAPQAYDAVRKDFYKMSNELSQLKEQYELAGGAEGIENLQSEAQEYAQALTKAANGDPSLWSDLHSDSPEGAARLAAAGLDYLERYAPEKFEGTRSRIVSRTLAQSGFAGTLSNLLEIITEGGAEAQKYALREAQKLAKWVKDTSDYARGIEEQERARPQGDEIDEREKNLAKREQSAYHSDVGRASNQRISPIIEKALAPMMQGKKLTAEQKQGLAAETYGIISAALGKNELYRKSLAAQMDKRKSADEIARWVATKVQELAPKAAKQAWAARGFGAAASPATGNGNRPRTVVSGRPKSEDIDWSKDPQRTRFMGGEATLKNGSVVRWDWNKV